MAERNQRKIADNSDFHPNDPFAELTQIMGFDPRVANIASARAASENDLGIDLERELLSDLASDQEFVRPAPAPIDMVPASAARPSEVSLDDDLDASLEAEMAADADLWPDAESQPREPAHVPAWAPVSHQSVFEPSQRPGEGSVKAANWNDQAPPRGDETVDDLALVDMDFLDLAVDDIAQDHAGDASADAMPALALDREAPPPMPSAHTATPVIEPSSLEDELSMLLGSAQETSRATAGDAPQPETDEFLDDLDAAWAEPQAHTMQGEEWKQDASAGHSNVTPSEAEAHADRTPSSEAASDVFADLARLAAGSTLPPLRSRPSLATPTLANAAFAATASAPAARDEPAPVHLDVEAYPDDEVGFASAADANTAFDADAPSFDVPDEPIAIVDDLDIPDLDFDEPVPASSYDDLDLDLPAPTARASEPANWTPPSAAALDDDFDAYDHELDVRSSEHERELRPYEQPETLAPPLAGAAVAAVAGAAAAPRNWFDNGAPARPTQTTSYQSASPVELGDSDFDFDAEDDNQPTFAEKAAATTRIGRRAPSRGGRGLLVAGLLAGVAVLGGIGLMFASFGGGDAEAPTIVRADPEPVKVKPENPGGTVVPNQDNPVYDRVGGVAADQTPTQETLISGAEEPVDVAAQSAAPVADADAVPALDGDAPEPTAGDTATSLPGVEVQPRMIDTSKNEDRVDPAATADEESSGADIVAVAPRRVRTMVVRPDGTMVPREEPPAAPVEVAAAPATAADAPAIEPATGTVAPQSSAEAPAPQAAAQTAQPAAPAVDAAATAAPATPAPVAATSDQPNAATEAAAPRTTSVTPARVPVAPARPADQPVQIVGEVAQPQTQVASAEPAAQAAAAAGGWTMQIASESSEDGAQNAWRNMSRRYASLLGDKNATIVRAEIPNKGTFYRVRVAAGSRNEAIQLCERLKSAGGNCFVSR